MLAARKTGYFLEKLNVLRVLKFRGQALGEQIIACPIASIKFLEQHMQPGRCTLHELLDLAIASQSHIIEAPNPCQEVSFEHMRSWINRDFLEEDPLIAQR